MKVQAQDYIFFEKLIKEARHILILTGKDPDLDVLGAAFFLEKTFSSLGKNIQIVAKGRLPADYSHLSGKIKEKIEPKKLVVSFNYRKNSIEKVSYDMDSENFNVLIYPRDKEISKEDVQLFHAGLDPDLAICLGLASLSDLEEYERNYLLDKAIVNIDKVAENGLYGRINFVKEGADSVCAIVADLLEKTSVQLPTTAADHLIMGLRAATENFTSVTDPTTFEAAAFSTRIKKGIKRQVKQVGEQQDPSVPKEWLAPKVFRSDHEIS